MSEMTGLRYNRAEVLSLKLRASTTLRRLTRAEMLTRMQIVRVVDPITAAAYKEVAAERHRAQADDSPHGHPWHVSFHGSQFPGDDPMACPRQSLYRMMDFPAPEPFNRNSLTVMAAGKSIETELVQTWHEAGLLLSAAPDEPIQTGFEDEEAWLTASVDSVILPRNWNKPLPVEVKSKYHEQVEQMRVGAKGPDPGHVKQLKVQLSIVRAAQEKGEKWSGYDPVDHGYLFYLSRDRPSVTAEFRVDLDRRFYEIGLKRLKQWKGMFMEDVLPQENPSKKHPMGWKWSYPPCQWCDFKKTCKLDFEQGTTQLTESVGVERAKLVRPHYDPAAARQRVKDRWDRSKIASKNRTTGQETA